MNYYVALLRGINVSGKNKIFKVDLINIFKKLGFVNVETYIQSGNIIFKTDILEATTATMITNAIKKQFNYDVPTIVLSYDKLKCIVEENPFNTSKVDVKKLYFAYLKSTPKNTQNLKSINFGKDEFFIKNDVIYLKYHLGAGKTKLTNTIIEKKLEVIATTRNWRTTNKILEILEKK